MRVFALLLLGVATLVASNPNTLSDGDVKDGWVLLFDGQTTFGWTAEGGAKWRADQGMLVADGDSGWLRSNASFNDFMLRLEFRVSKAETNSGVFVRSAPGAKPAETGYEIQIWDKHPKFPTGSIVNVAAARPAKLIPGKWHAYEVFAVGGRILIKMDGKKLLDAEDSRSKLGHIGLQYNKDNKTEFRSVRIRPLGMVPIFNGQNLNGWQEVKPPKEPKEPAEWSVKKGSIHVVHGPGQLETKNTWDDFVLQLDVRANSKDPAKHPNSGVFFRGTPGGYWTGYESQIRNEFQNGDRTKAVDFGTGGIYRYQPARRVIGKDNEFFTKMIIARGRQISVWVDGFPVSSWEDPNPEGTVVSQKQAVLRAGPISLQAHDPTTNLDFRRIMIRPLSR